MTSSLVGSEMCIRDRHTAAALRAELRALQRNIRHEHRVQHALAPVAAVSYTHLTLPTICSV
eukprot:7697913-Prorocentrum_lima.AAC.1